MRRTDREILAGDLLEAPRRVGEDEVPVTPDELDAVLAALDTYAAPEPPAAATAALIERLRTYVPAPEPSRSRRRFREVGLATSPWAVMGGLFIAQARLFHPAWWMLTLLLTLAWPYAAKHIGAPLALLAPPLVVAGVAYAFREVGTPAAEIELSCLVRPAHLALVRVLLVMGWVTALGLVGLAAGSASAAALTTWAAGMLLFGGATLALTLWAGPWGALGLGLVAWAALAIAQALPEAAARPIWVLTDGRAAALGAGLCALSLACAGRRLFRLPREEA
jgi:hypothetical protein